MAGWIGFAGMLMLIIGFIDVCEGLIALIEDDYFIVTKSGFLAVDLTTWGWVLLYDEHYDEDELGRSRGRAFQEDPGAHARPSAHAPAQTHQPCAREEEGGHDHRR